eukprot:TRINITY_DN732_c0_g1_i3.p1 TRINITY_DN732_c0_g1~~TRINITY_DN732_c0_g1_i3.p1  ORF type:complete len:1491 (-),score=166.73 TRINITY_DN732_c0_g1_i3:1047-5519(-)
MSVPTEEDVLRTFRITLDAKDRFDGKDYRAWAFQMEFLIDGHPSSDHIFGTPPRECPPDPEDEDSVADKARKTKDVQKWKSLDKTGRKIIVMNVTRALFPLVEGHKTALEMWRALEERYKRTDQTNALALSHEYHEMKMAPRQSILEYALALQRKVAELSEAGEDISEQKAVFHFASTLTPAYRTFRTQVADWIPSQLTWKRVLSRAQAEESLIKSDDERMLGEEALRASRKGKEKVNFSHGEKKVCKYCKKDGHDVSECFKLKAKKAAEAEAEMAAEANSVKDKRCYNCNEFGHFKRECPDKKKETPRAYVAHESDSDSDEERHRGHMAILVEDTPTNASVPSYVLTSNGSSLSLGLSSIPTKLSSHARALISASQKNQFILDSGATAHFTFQKELLHDFTEVSGFRISVANDHDEIAIGKGTLHVTKALPDGSLVQGTFEPVYYVPNFGVNLLSVAVLEDQNLQCNFGEVEREAHLWSKSDMTLFGVAKRKNESKLYIMDIISEAVESAALVVVPSLDGYRMHEKLGHLHFAAMQTLSTEGKIPRLSPQDKSAILECSACLKAKLSLRPFRSILPSHRPTTPLALVSMDLCGPFRTPSLSKAKHLLLFVDSATRFMRGYFITTKSQSYEKFRDYVAWAERTTGHKLKRIRSDHGGEFENQEFFTFCKESGIIHEFAAPYTPQQNSMVERGNRTVVEGIRAALVSRNLPNKFWAEAARNFINVRNSLPNKHLDRKSPQMLWDGTEVDLTKLHAFGTPLFFKIPDLLRTKLENKSEEGFYLGTGSVSGAHRIWDLSATRVRDCATVRFLEDKTLDLHEVEGEIDKWEMLDSTVRYDQAPPPVLLPIPLDPTHDVPQPATPLAIEGEPLSSTFSDHVPTPSSPPPLCDDDFGTYFEEWQHKNPEIRRSDRIAAQRAMLSISPLSQSKPKRVHLSDTELSKYAEWGASTMITSDGAGNLDVQELIGVGQPDPATYADALKSAKSTKWQSAMKDEITSLDKNGTWTLEDLPPGRKAIPCKWVYKTKRHLDGTVDRYKARLVAKGFMQKEGLDYFETFAPVVKLAALRLLLSFACLFSWIIEASDVDSAFLNGILKETIFMKQPEGFTCKGYEAKVCRLLKTLYGLKQAARGWNEEFVSFMISQGFHSLHSEPSIFIRGSGSDFIAVAFHVDDMLIMSPSQTVIDSFKSSLQTRFGIKDLGRVKVFLGMEVSQDLPAKTVRLSQKNYAQSLLSRYGMADCIPASTPINPNNEKLTRAQCPSTPLDKAAMADKPYRGVVGSLMYLMCVTRPDLAYPIGLLSQFLENPGQAHWDAAMYVLRYVKGTADYYIEYSGNSFRTPHGFCDASFAEDMTDRCSFGGHFFTVAGGVISWRSQKQGTVARSTSESEFYECSQAAQEAMYLRLLYSELGFPLEDPIPIYTDNKSAQALLRSETITSRTKHMGVHMHYAREKVVRGAVTYEYLKTSKQGADCMTKPLAPRLLANCISCMGLQQSG